MGDQQFVSHANNPGAVPVGKFLHHVGHIDFVTQAVGRQRLVVQLLGHHDGAPKFQRIVVAQVLVLEHFPARIHLGRKQAFQRGPFGVELRRRLQGQAGEQAGRHFQVSRRRFQQLGRARERVLQLGPLPLRVFG